MLELNWKEGSLFTLEEKGTKKTFCYTGRSASCMKPSNFECASLVAWANDFLTRPTSTDHLSALAKNLTENTDNLRMYAGTASLIKFNKIVTHNGGFILCPEKVKNAILNKEFSINHIYREDRYIEFLQLADLLIKRHKESPFSPYPERKSKCAYRVYRVRPINTNVWDFKLNSVQINNDYYYEVFSTAIHENCTVHGGGFQIKSAKKFLNFAELKVAVENKIQDELKKQATQFDQFGSFRNFKRDHNHDWYISHAIPVSCEDDTNWACIRV